jgi:hypothetical protein
MCTRRPSSYDVTPLFYSSDSVERVGCNSPRPSSEVAIADCCRAGNVITAAIAERIAETYR